MLKIDELIIYLDDSSDSDILAQVLRANKFKAVTPRKSKTLGFDDSEHIEFASKNNYTILTFDEGYVQWSDSLIKSGKAHSGILIVYRYNNPKKDMTAIKIVKAIKNLIKSGQEISNKCHNLNLWNY